MSFAQKVTMRRFERKQVRNPSILMGSIIYMGDTYVCNILDISLGGVCVNMKNIPFSLINNSIIKFKSSNDNFDFSISARIVYSYKENQAFQSRNYGIEFLSQSLILQLL